MRPGWALAVRLPSPRRLLLTACCFPFSVLRCEYKLLLPGDWTLILFPGCRDGNWSLRDGCCGHHPFLRELARCFSNSWAGCRAGSRLKACCFPFLALRCDMHLLPGDQTLIVLPGYRDGCCGPHFARREQARCFSCSPWSQAVILLSMRMVPLPALGSMFLALRCECMCREPGGRTRILFPGQRDGCCGPRLSHREQARCFSNSWVWRRAVQQQALAGNLSSNRDFLHQACVQTFLVRDGWRLVSLLCHRTRLLGHVRFPFAHPGRTRCSWYQAVPLDFFFSHQRSLA
jgi:hypothetical protein